MIPRVRASLASAITANAQSSIQTCTTQCHHIITPHCTYDAIPCRILCLHEQDCFCVL